MNNTDIEKMRIKVEAIASDEMYGDLPFIHPARDGKILPRELLKLIDLATTTESQITSGKTESIHDEHQFQILLNEYAKVFAEYRNEKAEWEDTHKPYNALIAHIEAVREKDRKEAFSKALDEFMTAKDELKDEWKERAEKAESTLAANQPNINNQLLIAANIWQDRAQAAEADRDHFKAKWEANRAGREYVELSDKELSDPEYMRAYVEGCQDGFTTMLTSRNHFKAIVARQAAGLAKLDRLSYTNRYGMDDDPTGAYVRFSEVEALLEGK